MFKNKRGFTCLVKAFRSNPLHAMPRSRIARFSHTECRFAHSFAFTLAEVLVTVSVIGIITMLVLPNLYRTTDAKVSIAAAKKAKMDVHQVAMKVQMECPRFRCNDVDSVIKKYFPEDTTEISYYFYKNNAKKVAIDVDGNKKLDFGYQFNADGTIQEIGTGNCTFAKAAEGKTTCDQSGDFKIDANVYSKR